jgi:TrwC relaxase
MSIHKLTAGSGYDYLTRQVAAFDATAKSHVGLASYYMERGESPGRWVGSGLVGVDGLEAGEAVTGEQMQALFGAGMHPLATQRMQQLRDADLTDANVETATRLGAPFKIAQVEPGQFRVELAKRIAAFNKEAGLPGDWPISPAERAGIRTELARELFAAEHGRSPADAREVAGTIAKHSRPGPQPVAGFDLTFSPVKSVSTLWAVADRQMAAQIEQAHHAAVGDALRFLEEHALFTREGPQGIRQVNVAAWWLRRLPIGTAAPAIPTCTPMSPSRTRSKPSAGGGCRSTAGCCSRRRWLRRRPTTLPWRSISGTVWECGSRTGRTRIRGNSRYARSSVSIQR